MTAVRGGRADKIVVRLRYVTPELLCSRQESALDKKCRLADCAMPQIGDCSCAHPGADRMLIRDR